MKNIVFIAFLGALTFNNTVIHAKKIAAGAYAEAMKDVRSLYDKLKKEDVVINDEITAEVKRLEGVLGKDFQDPDFLDMQEFYEEKAATKVITPGVVGEVEGAELTEEEVELRQLIESGIYPTTVIEKELPEVKMFVNEPEVQKEFTTPQTFFDAYVQLRNHNKFNTPHEIFDWDYDKFITEINEYIKQSLSEKQPFPFIWKNNYLVRMLNHFLWKNEIPIASIKKTILDARDKIYKYIKSNQSIDDQTVFEKTYKKLREVKTALEHIKNPQFKDVYYSIDFNWKKLPDNWQELSEDEQMKTTLEHIEFLRKIIPKNKPYVVEKPHELIRNVDYLAELLSNLAKTFAKSSSNVRQGLARIFDVAKTPTQLSDFLQSDQEINSKNSLQELLRKIEVIYSQIQ